MTEQVDECGRPFIPAFSIPFGKSLTIIYPGILPVDGMREWDSHCQGVTGGEGYG
jgi:hypothetical protein